MNSSPSLPYRTVLRGTSAAQAVTFTPEALADLPVPSVPTDDATSATEPDRSGDAVAAPLTHGREAVAASTGAPVDAEGPSGGPLRFEQVYADQMAVLREQAQREGFEAGHAEGMAAAEQAVAEMVETARAQVQSEQAAWRTQAQSALTALSDAVAALDARTTPTLTEMTDSLSRAAYTLVEDLLGRELAAATDPAREAVERALRLVPADEPVVVRLHPDDHATLDTDWVAGLRGTVTLIADPAVETAGAIAEAGARRVDAQLSTALGRVREVLGA